MVVVVVIVVVVVMCVRACVLARVRACEREREGGAIISPCFNNSFDHYRIIPFNSTKISVRHTSSKNHFELNTA